MVYMFEENDGSFKIWDHLMIELIDRPKAKSWMQSMFHFLYSAVVEKQSESICVLTDCNDQCNTSNGLAMVFPGTAVLCLKLNRT